MIFNDEETSTANFNFHLITYICYDTKLSVLLHLKLKKEKQKSPVGATKEYLEKISTISKLLQGLFTKNVL